jgi:hypothetical protein
MSARSTIEEAEIVSETGTKKRFKLKKWLTYTLWIVGVVAAISLLVIFGIFSRIGDWIQNDRYYIWSLTKFGIGAALIFFSWSKAYKVKKTGGGLATIGKEFKPLSLGAFGVYTGIAICLWAILPVIIPFVFSFLGKYGWWVLVGVLGLIATFFFINSKKKTGWTILVVATGILIIVNKGIIVSTMKSFGSDDAVTAKTDSVKTDMVPPTESTDTPVGPAEVVDETTVQQPVPKTETPVETVIETPTIAEQSIVDTAAIAASDPTIQRKIYLRDSLRKANILSAVNKSLDVEIAQLKGNLVPEKKGKGRKKQTAPCPDPTTTTVKNQNKNVGSTFREVVASGSMKVN